MKMNEQKKENIEKQQKIKRNMQIWLTLALL